MDKFVTKTKRNQNFGSSSSRKPNEEDCDKRVRLEVEISDDVIIADPGLRKPIDSYPFEMRARLRRQYLLKGPCQPFGHKFPFTTDKYGHKRKFQEAWFSKYKDWLEYSISKDAAFCLFCYLFKDQKAKGDTFTVIGCTNWKKALQKFIEHIEGVNSTHNGCRMQVRMFQNQRENVDYVMSSTTTTMEVQYRTRLTAVLKVIRYLLGQGLAFRGHDESETSMNRGNFLELVAWYCENNEDVNKVMQSNAPKNNQMTCSSIQRELIDACAKETIKVILNEIGKKKFSLLIDEARDCSVKEQMAVVLRFVSDGGEVTERFLGLLHVSETSAQCLKRSIDDFFGVIGLSLSRLRGQGYDGASNMRGELNGLKKLILNENKHAHYIHCFAHQLQLVIVTAAADHRDVRSFFDKLSMIVNLCGASCKRKDALRKLFQEEVAEKIKNGEISTGKGQHQETSLTRPGDTRWGSHFKTILSLFNMWNPVKEVLLSVYEDGNTQKARSDAGGLIDHMFSFEFVFIAKFMLNLLGKTNALSKILQAKDQNIQNAVRMIEVTKRDLETYKNNGWEQLLEQVTKFCFTNKIYVPNMEDEIPGRGQRIRDGGEPKTYLKHFREDTFMKVIDVVVEEMDNRFTELNSELLMCIACLDPTNSFANFDHVRLLRLAELYSDDFSSCDLLELEFQLDQYISDVRSNEAFFDLADIGDLARKMVDMKYHTVFHLVYRLIELALILPVATATVERCFSAMNIIKTDLRNRMGDDYLTDCLVCYIEKKIFKSIDDEVILQHFQNSGSRRLQLLHARGSGTANN